MRLTRFSKKERVEGLLILAALSVFVAEGVRSRHDQFAERSFKTLRIAWNPPLESSRALAEDGRESEAVPCLRERLTHVEALRAENARLEQEQSRGKLPISGTWKGLDLSRLPVPQAEYLTRYGDLITVVDPSRIRECQDIRCIFDDAYGKKNSSEAERIYYFYLTMGFPVGVTRDVPGFHQDGIPLVNYLFTDEELIALDEVSAFLSPMYRSMWSYRAIFRVPTGASLGNMTAGEYTGTHEGAEEQVSVLDENIYIKVPQQVYFSHQAGYARIIPETAVLSHPPSAYQDSFYLTVIHELTHGIDHDAGPVTGSTAQDRTYGSLSDTADWYSLGAWRPKTIVEFNRLKGTQRLWEVDRTQAGAADAEDGVTGYAHFSPSEDFAETAAYFRMRPEGVQLPRELKLFPRKYKFISDRLYGGRTYDRAGLAKFYLAEIQRSVSERLPAVVAQCSTPDGKCVSERMPELYRQAVNHLRRTDIDACPFFDSKENMQLLSARIPELMTPATVPLIAANTSLTPTPVPSSNPSSGLVIEEISAPKKVAVLKETTDALRKNLEDKVDPRELYLGCLIAEDAQGCYLGAVSQAFDGVAASYLDQLQGWLDVEKKNYLESASFTMVRGRTEKETDTVLHGITSAVLKSEKKLWARCSAEKSEMAEPLLLPFTGGEHEVPSAVLHCINQSVVFQISDLIVDFVGRPELKGSLWVSFASERVLALYLELLHAEFEKKIKPVLAECHQNICKNQKVGLTEDGYSYRGTVTAIYLNGADQSLLRFELNLTSAWSKRLKKYVPIRAPKFWTSHLPEAR